MTRRITLCCLFSIGSLCAMAQTVNIPDNHFLQHLNDLGIDTNSDGLIQEDEAEAVTEIEIFPGDSIKSLEGISAFMNLETFSLIKHRVDSADFRECLHLQSLTISGNEYSHGHPLTPLEYLRVDSLQQLKYLTANDNNLRTINLTNLPSLRVIDITGARLSKIEAPQSINLRSYKVHWNELTELDLSYYPNLRYAGLGGILIDSLSFPHNPRLQQVSASEISHIDLSHNDSIKYVIMPLCRKIKHLDLSNLFQLHTLNIDQCFNLEYLNIKNGSRENEVIANWLYDTYICIDEDEEDLAQEWFESRSAIINSFCTFHSADATNKIQGKFYISTNGTDCVDEVPVDPMMRIDVSGDLSGSHFQGNMDDYEIHLPTGQYDVSYNHLHPLAFTVEPSTLDVEFTGNDDTIHQDICFIGQNDVQDISVMLWPEYNVRPGFTQSYILEITNTGNSIASGTATFHFPDTLFEVTEVFPMPSDQSPGSISWDFSNLTPLTKTYGVVDMRANSPMDNPPLSGGELITMSAEAPLSGDDTPMDNSQEIILEVKNSFDPNDKTCLTGTTISPTALDGYLNYKIRFENTGSAEAVNIVVRDVIDTSRYDISSLVPISASHGFKTNLKKDHIVEFIFEEINLPYNDEDNDGYILFKIKPKNDLSLGDRMINKAEIFFDYNYPIVTDPSVVRVEQLSSTLDLESSWNLAIYPNPTADRLHIQAGDDIQSISIYSTAGKLMTVEKNTSNSRRMTVSVAEYPEGMYQVEINTSLGKKSAPFQIAK